MWQLLSCGAARGRVGRLRGVCGATQGRVWGDSGVWGATQGCGTLTGRVGEEGRSWLGLSLQISRQSLTDNNSSDNIQ